MSAPTIPLPSAFPPATLFLVAARTCARLGVRELPRGSNAGPMLTAIHAAAGGKDGDAWCAQFLAFCGRVVETVGVDWPLPFTGSCDALLAAARAQNRLCETPAPGRLFLRIAKGSSVDARHVGLVVAIHGTKGRDGWSTIEGNAADPKSGATDEGWGVFEGRVRGHAADVNRYLFVDPWSAGG